MQGELKIVYSCSYLLSIIYSFHLLLLIFQWMHTLDTYWIFSRWTCFINYSRFDCITANTISTNDLFDFHLATKKYDLVTIFLITRFFVRSFRSILHTLFLTIRSYAILDLVATFQESMLEVLPILKQVFPSAIPVANCLPIAASNLWYVFHFRLYYFKHNIFYIL